MGDWGLYIILLVPTLLLGLGVQWWLKKTFDRYSHIDLVSGLTGAEVARQILDRNGLEGVPIDRADGRRRGEVNRQELPERCHGVIAHSVNSTT